MWARGSLMTQVAAMDPAGPPAHLKEGCQEAILSQQAQH